MALITFADALEAVQDFIGTNGLARAQRDIRRAVSDAYDELLQEHSWHYYRTQWGFATVASNSTGTLTYVHSTRTVTFSDALSTTVQGWAERATIRCDAKTVEVERYVSSTSVILSEDSNFGADISDATTFDMVCDHYLTPENFRSIGDIYGKESGWWSRRISPEEFLYQRNNGWTAGEPACYTVMQDRQQTGRTAIFLYPAPSSLRSYDLIISESARPIRWAGNEPDATAGTITLTAGSKTLSGSGSNFLRSMVGSVIRPGTTSLAPTSIDDPKNPYVEQFVIKTRTSATAGTLDVAPVGDYTAVKYTISDPIDMEAQMQKAFIALCKLKICAARPNDHGEFYQIVAGEYGRLLENAKCTDNKVRSVQRTGGLPYWRRLASFPSDGV